ncbi:MAG: hypothetical protein MR854_00260 [Clostridiaceae bacterium]|nr:hypothetical protein [Clostridiaceae bacterium]
MTKKQISELNKIIKQVPADKRAIATNLVEEIKFMYDTMEELKSKIRQYGTVELFEQGKQKFLRENPAVKSYNTTIQRYSTLYKQLTELLPKTVQAPPGSELLEFINRE